MNINKLILIVYGSEFRGYIRGSTETCS